MDGAVLDACCFINLYAGGRLEEVLASTVGRASVPQVVLEETLFIRRPSPDDPSHRVSTPIDLTPARQSGAVVACALETQAELASFVELAALVDDGEAAAIATAAMHGSALATDDRRARRVAADRGIPLVSTPQLLRRWAEASGAGPDVLADMLREIEEGARFRPRRSDPDHDWWQRNR